MYYPPTGISRGFRHKLINRLRADPIGKGKPRKLKVCAGREFRVGKYLGSQKAVALGRPGIHQRLERHQECMAFRL